MIRPPEESEAFTDLMEVLLRIAAGVEKIVEVMLRESPDNWRGHPATERQKAFMSKHRIPFSEPLTKGQASDLIDGYRANQTKRG